MIKVWDYLAELDNERTEIQGAIDEVLSSGWLILGKQVENFEDAFSTYCGVESGVGVNSGTDAIFLGLKALGVGPGDEVITVANTAVPTVSAIVSTGATPVFVDIHADTYLMNVELLDAVFTTKTKCVLPVHLYGQCVEMAMLRLIAEKYGVPVLEDCAQAHGATYRGKKAGSMSALAAFSFYPTKILGGYGDGGMVVTNNETYRNALRRLRFYGMEGEYNAIEHGYNSRLDELHAAILMKKLAHLDDYVQRRRYLAARYDQALANTSLVLPVCSKDSEHAFYLYVCRHEKRDDWIAALKERGILVNVSYRWPIHLMEAQRSLGYKAGDLPVTENAADEIFSLPMYPSLSDDEQDKVIAAILEIDGKL